WKAGDAAVAPSLSGADGIDLTRGPTGIAVSSDGKTGWVASAGSDTLAKLDLVASPTITSSDYVVTGTDLAVLAGVSSAEPDLLLGGDPTSEKLHLIDPSKTSPSAPINAVPLASKPTAVVAGSGGAWGYVELDTDQIQIVDLGKMRSGLATTPSTPFDV